MDTKETIINVQNFILATRDSGYKSTSAALAELIDNSIEAGALNIYITIEKIGKGNFSIEIRDDAKGMTAEDLNVALQFGGSSRFNSRKGMGRYGMGLPNSSLSQAKRVEVLTWTNPKKVYWNYLDVEEIASGKVKSLLTPKVIDKSELKYSSLSGTVIRWHECDRLSNKNMSVLIESIKFELGRVFRHHLWNGKKILINYERIVPIDPLCVGIGNNLLGATLFGDPLEYDIKIPNSINNLISKVIVKFVEFPLEEWFTFSNEEKNERMISKYAGVSILRAKREIDYGWFFMGSKRKENYDDWWRCEISFEPQLDELFGVTHTKQEIHPSEYLKQILSPDLETIARQLNNRVRNRFIQVKGQQIGRSYYEIEKQDVFIEPPEIDQEKLHKEVFLNQKKGLIRGLEYELVITDLVDVHFYKHECKEGKLTIFLNKNHPFFSKIFEPLINLKKNDSLSYLRQIEILIFAAARAEILINDDVERKLLSKYMENWSKILIAFLS